MKIVRLGTIVLVLTLVGLFAYSIPQFYFNSLEYKSSVLFTETEEINKLAGDHIEQRSGREGGLKTPEELKSISLTVQLDLDHLEDKIKEHEIVSVKQNKISPLLSSTHNNYLRQKNLAFEKYYLSLRKFKKLKEFESLTHEVLLSRGDTKNLVINAIASKPPNFTETDKLVTELTKIKSILSEYQKDGYLTDEYYQVLINELDSNIEYINIFKIAITNNYTNNQIEPELAKNLARYDDTRYSKALNDSVKTKVEIKREEWNNYYSEFDEKSILAAEYYKNNKLYNDPISILLSKFNKSYPKNLFGSLLSDFHYEDKFADLNGDGTPEKLRLILSNNSSLNENPKLIAYDHNNIEKARLPDSMPINDPLDNSGKVYTLNNRTERQAVSFDFSVGTHEIQTMFFELVNTDEGLVILPICLKKEAIQASDCLFWSSEPGYLKADDFNDDGILDVAEIVSEYPKDGPISKELESGIKSAGADKEINNVLLRIAKREAGGRGEPVIWDIYSYNGEYFQKSDSNEYQKLFIGAKEHLKPIGPQFSNIKRRQDISKDSENYNIFIRTIWTTEHTQDDNYYTSSPLS